MIRSDRVKVENEESKYLSETMLGWNHTYWNKCIIFSSICKRFLLPTRNRSIGILFVIQKCTLCKCFIVRSGSFLVELTWLSVLSLHVRRCIHDRLHLFTLSQRLFSEEGHIDSVKSFVISKWWFENTFLLNLWQIKLDWVAIFIFDIALTQIE